MIAFAPMAAVKLTMDCLAAFHYILFVMDFDNWELQKANWSLKLGVGMFFLNFILWSAVGIFIDFVFNGKNYIC